MTTIAIINDDDGLRRAVAAIVESEGYACATYADGDAFRAAHRGGVTDLAVIGMPPGRQPAAAVLESLGMPTFPVVMISGDLDRRTPGEAGRLGAAAVLHQPFTSEMLLDVIGSCLPSRSGTRVAADDKPSGRPRSCLHVLTPREREVAMALHNGLSNKEVAQQLGCSPRTIEVHRSRIFAKLGVHNIAGFVRTVSGR